MTAFIHTPLVNLALAVALALAFAPPQAQAQAAASAPTPAPTVALPQAEAAKPAAAVTAPRGQQESAHVFAVMAGAWSGGGTLTLSSGTRERLRCLANHVLGSGRSLSLSIRCASDSYTFNLSSQVVERRGRIYGRWSESSNGVSGTISGQAAGNRVRARASGDAFTADLALTTSGRRQSVAIVPHGTFIAAVQIALRKR